MSSDPFLTAWGQGVSWRGGQHQARLLSGLDVSLVNQAAERCWRLTWAIGQCEGLMEEALLQSEALLEDLRQAELARAMSALRSSRRGPGWWRRYWFRRALHLAPLVKEALAIIVLANQRTTLWHQAIVKAMEALEIEQRVPWPDGVVPVHCWKLDEAVTAALDNLASARDHLQAQVEAGQRLEVKANRFLAVAAAIPETQADPLASPWVQAARSKALEAPLSGVPGLAE